MRITENFVGVLSMLVLAAVVLMMQGCVCERHPAYCAVAGAIVVGSVAASVEMRHHHQSQQPGVPPSRQQDNCEILQTTTGAPLYPPCMQ